MASKSPRKSLEINKNNESSVATKKISDRDVLLFVKRKLFADQIRQVITGLDRNSAFHSDRAPYVNKVREFEKHFKSVATVGAKSEEATDGKANVAKQATKKPAKTKTKDNSVTETQVTNVLEKLKNDKALNSGPELRTATDAEILEAFESCIKPIAFPKIESSGDLPTVEIQQALNAAEESGKIIPPQVLRHFCTETIDACKNKDGGCVVYELPYYGPSGESMGIFLVTGIHENENGIMYDVNLFTKNSKIIDAGFKPDDHFDGSYSIHVKKYTSKDFSLNDVTHSVYRKLLELSKKI